MSNKHLEHEHETPDSWHRHGTEEGAPQHEHGAHASARALAVTFIAMTLGVAFVIIILVAYFNSYNARYRKQVEETTVLGRDVRTNRAAAVGELNQYGWIDHESVQIPIDEAMEAVVTERSGGED